MNGCIPRVRENSEKRSPYSDGGGVENKRVRRQKEPRNSPRYPCPAASDCVSRFLRFSLSSLSLATPPFYHHDDLLSFSSYRSLYSPTPYESLVHLSFFVSRVRPFLTISFRSALASPLLAQFKLSNVLIFFLSFSRPSSFSFINITHTTVVIHIHSRQRVLVMRLIKRLILALEI